MDVRQLNTFLQVAELGSLSKAADRLRIAQPALSRQVRLLEHELKVALFSRHGRGMALTEAGEMLRARAGSILRQIDQARADLMQQAGAVRGHVAFGLPPTVGAVLATRLIDRFLSTYPNVTLRIVHGFSGYLIEWLQHGELDIAVIYGAPHAGGVRQSPLLVENLHLVAAGDSPLTPHHAVPFAQVAAQRLVLPGAAHGLRKLIEAEARLRGIPLQIVVEADDLQVLKDLARMRLGSTVLPLAAVQAEVTRGELAAAPIIDPHITRKLVVAEPLGRQASNAVLCFGQVLRAEVATMVRSGTWNGQLLMEDTIQA
jgi:LysR family nitrogen assimilation transcriptional regulator